MFEFIVDKLKNKLIDKKLAFFVGAGIDYHSSVPPFESFFSALHKHTDIDELLNIFKIGNINTNHSIGRIYK
jgi:hypothetical protein